MADGTTGEAGADTHARERPRDHVTGTLARRILSGAIPPGARLPTETELTHDLGVSRTALRESMRTLAGKGLIESRRRTGTIVQPRANWNDLDPEILAWRETLPPDLDFVRSLIEARAVIEPAAAAFAAERATAREVARLEAAFETLAARASDGVAAMTEADEAFHSELLRTSHNHVFANFAAVIGTAVRHSSRLTNVAAGDIAGAIASHGEVVEAIRLRRPDEARALMERVIGIARDDLARAIASGAPPGQH